MAEKIGQQVVRLGTGGVVHDFNNLLAVVSDNFDLLRKRLPEDPKATRLLEGALQGAQPGAALIQRMVAFARGQNLRADDQHRGQPRAYRLRDR